MMRGERGGMIILAVMVVVTIVYAAVTFRNFRLSRQFYAGAWTSNIRPDVLYGFGTPKLISNGGGRWVANATPAQAAAYRMWRYATTQGGIVVVSFADDGHVARVSCTSETASPFGCPGVLGVAMGDDEVATWMRLGTPTRQRYVGDVKILNYDDLGLELTMRQYIIHGIALNDRATGGLGRYFRLLIP